MTMRRFRDYSEAGGNQYLLLYTVQTAASVSDKVCWQIVLESAPISKQILHFLLASETGSQTNGWGTHFGNLALVYLD